MTLCVSLLPPQKYLQIYHQAGMNAMRGHCCIDKNPLDYQKIKKS
jgi:hypothetical protein